MPRGIVIGQRVSSEEGFSMHGAVQISDVVKWLLYWDKITYASVGFGGASIAGNQPEDINYLESLGVFDTEIVDIQSLGPLKLPPPEPGASIFGIAGNQYLIVSAAVRVKLCEVISQRTGEIWTLGQSGGETLILPSPDQSKELLDIQLINCLPVPERATPFEEILNFKGKYQAELEHLRYSLDELREKVLSSSDERRALDSAMREISISLEDMKNAMKGKGINTLSETISLYTDNPSIGFWSALGGIAAASQGIPYEVAAGAGLAAPTAFKFLKRNIFGAQTLPDTKSDFTYAFEITRDFK